MTTESKADQPQREGVLAGLDSQATTGFYWYPAVLSILAIGFVARYLPETKGLPLEEVTAVFDRQTTGRESRR